MKIPSLLVGFGLFLTALAELYSGKVTNVDCREVKIHMELARWLDVSSPLVHKSNGWWYGDMLVPCPYDPCMV